MCPANNLIVLSNPPPSDFVEEWYEMATGDHFWMEWRFRAFLRQIQDLALPIKQPLTGLDIGCGAGILCEQLENATAWAVDGTDLNRQALSNHRGRRGRTLLYDINERRAEMRQRYDFVVLFDVLEHIPEPAPFLDSALFHLKPGGWLFVNVPAFNSLMSVYDLSAGHVRRYDRKMMAAGLAGHSLDIVDMRYWGASMLPLVLLRKLLARGKKPGPEVIKNGFLVSEPFNKLLKGLARVETAVIARPPAGSSLLAVAIKTDVP